ncbi:MAG: hypothetical protein LBT44_01415 [Clostridiales bacterium]|nr:hypothetical protein [Clostridiales bacterium]
MKVLGVPGFDEMNEQEALAVNGGFDVFNILTDIVQSSVGLIVPWGQSTHPLVDRTANTANNTIKAMGANFKMTQDNSLFLFISAMTSTY